MILWTAGAPGSDNELGSSPFAPMKIKFLKNLVLGNRARISLILLALLIPVWCALTPGAAQSKNQKRITSVQIGEAGEGARVTVVADSMMNDYEAFRRGDRFYVRIPLADFVAGKPGFRGDGFEDVQVQKVGDSIVFSFKLQPGATARVDQRSNRLDVIFSSPNRMERRSRTNTGSSRSTYVPTDGIVRVNNSKAMRTRQGDAAGPMPPGSPGSPTATRERLVTGGSSGFSARLKQSAANNPRESSSKGGSNRSAGNIGSFTSKSGAAPTVSKTAPPVSARPAETSSFSKTGSAATPAKYGSTPVATPSASPSYPAFATSTPSTQLGTQATKSPSLASSQNGKSRTDLALQWIKANRQATLIGGLLGLLLLLVLVALLVRRRKNTLKAKRSGQPLAQPKRSADVTLNSPAAAPVTSPSSNMPSTELVDENTARGRESELSPAAVPVAPANGARQQGTRENAERARLVPEQAKAKSAAVTTNHAWVPPSPSSGSSAEEDQEREVFEL